MFVTDLVLRADTLRAEFYLPFYSISNTFTCIWRSVLFVLVTSMHSQLLCVFPQPAYFMYLLRVFCLSPTGAFVPGHFLSLANAVIAVFVTSFGPFILMKNSAEQIRQIISRLFPFTRGLNHAYWAPNFWALVTTLDRLLLKCKDYPPT